METKLLIGWWVIAFTYLIGWWRTFEKTGRRGWACVIPLYNLHVALDIAGRPGWWLGLLFLPPINFFTALVLWIDFAAVFGRHTLFALGLWFPPTHLLFMLYLGVSDIEYEGI